MKAKPSVLLIEDNAGDVYLVREALRRHEIDCVLTHVNDADLAMELLGRIGTSPEQICPDLVLLDVNLPKGNGLEILLYMRGRLECADLRVIVVTSSDSPKDRQRAAELGVQAYFRKPSTLSEFMKLGELVREVCGASAHLAMDSSE